MKKILSVLVFVLAFVFAEAKAQQIPFGMNIAGGDFGGVFPGVDGLDYGYPNHADLDYWHAKGLQLIRVPFRWERLQHEPFGELHEADFKQVRDVVEYANSLGMIVLLDMHNYCRRYDGGKEIFIGSKELPYSAYGDFWKRFATEMRDYRNLFGYGLMNEPHDLPSGIKWFDMAQVAIDSIRTVDTETPIVVGGWHWSSARRWAQLSDHLKFLNDPSHNLVFEAHCYFDFDGSGTYKFSYDEEEGSPLKGIELVEPFVSWLHENNLRGIVGEYGIDEFDPRWRVTADNFLKYLATNNVPATYWASGSRWSPDAEMTIPTPKPGETEKPQLPTLVKYPHTYGNRLMVSENGRYLVNADGTPFLYLADTAWELLARLDIKDAELYLKNRKEKGFNVVQTVIWPELDSITVDDNYLNHVEKVLQMAEDMGIYLALVPTWGDKVDKQWGKGPELFTPVSARAYGEMLSKRLSKYPNIIWIIGGDRGGDGKNRAVWNALAEGIKKYDKIHLMTYHPHGEHSSSMWFHNEPWLDFNMIQSGHCQHDYSIYERLLLPDMALSPRKPVMDGEPRYEDIVKDFKPENPRFNAHDVRKTLYQSMLSGACGYTYGNNNIWQMYTSAHKPECSASTSWKEALDMEGADDIRWFVKLWNMFPFQQATTLNNALQCLDGTNTDKGVAMCAGNMVIAYMPEGRTWQIETSVKPKTMQWFNPRTGQLSKVRGAKKMGKTLTLTLPTNEDYILIIK